MPRAGTRDQLPDHLEHPVDRIESSRLEQGVGRMTLLLCEGRIVGVITFPDGGNLHEPISIEQVAVDQTRRTISDHDVGPGPVEVVVGRFSNRGVGKAENHFTVSLVPAGR